MYRSSAALLQQPQFSSPILSSSYLSPRHPSCFLPHLSSHPFRICLYPCSSLSPSPSSAPPSSFLVPFSSLRARQLLLLFLFQALHPPFSSLSLLLLPHQVCRKPDLLDAQDIYRRNPFFKLDASYMRYFLYYLVVRCNQDTCR
jgi:hypothetical protein